MRQLILFSILLSSFMAWACMTGAPSTLSKTKIVSSKPSFSEKRKSKSRKPADHSPLVLPDSQHNPWGGSDASLWNEESVFANAVSQSLNESWSLSGNDPVQEVLVSVPVHMLPGQVPVNGNNFKNRPYGDGQTNAHLSFGNSQWLKSKNKKSPQLVSSLVTFKSGARKLKLKFHATLLSPGKNFAEIFSDGKSFIIKDVSAYWNVPVNLTWGDLFSNHVAFVRLQGMSDWFPLDFRDVVLSNTQLIAQVPTTQQKLGKGTLLDPELVKDSQFAAYDVIHSDQFAKDLNSQYYSPVIGIHNLYFDSQGKSFSTAVGNGTTVVIPSASMNPAGPAPFKMAYLCFDARDPHQEAVTGAPSGAGWHEIGDPAETVINSLEEAPVIFGYANGQPANKTPNGNFAFGLTDIAVVRLLLPGSALLTAAGDQTLKEGDTNDRGTGAASGRNYHWFIFHHSQNVCAMEWVHPCVPSPSNHLGTFCGH